MRQFAGWNPCCAKLSQSKIQNGMTTLIHQRVEAARQGTNPTVICRLASGWVVLGDVQFLRGYSLLLPDPVVPNLNALSANQRLVFLREMAIVGDALLEVTGAARINYEILGNSEPALHAHIFPRYATESEAYKHRPVWFYDWKAAPRFDSERDQPLMQQMAEAIGRHQARQHQARQSD
jgi:diadenosine tetraphosphate (Ap4A) HIT family hydrolase